MSWTKEQRAAHMREQRANKDPQAIALAQAKVVDIDTSAVDLVDQLEKCKEILRREISNLLQMSITGKLDTRASEGLVQYTKLLSQLVKEEEKRADEVKSEST